jgi:anti-sigma factor RsiW
MSAPGCEQLGVSELAGYATGELSEAAAVTLENHVFSCADCAARAAELEALVRGIRRAIESAEIGAFVTDDILNRLAREGVRVRTYALSPGAVVPCAVWDDDQLMAVRLRGDFGDATTFTVSQRVAGRELMRATGPVAVRSNGEIIHMTPAAWIRQLPAAEVEFIVTARDRNEDRTIGRYTLIHAGSFHR